MTYTSDQQSAIEKFSEFIHSDHDVFILSGYAGTGKTTLMKSMIDSLQSSEDSLHKAVLMAPTGRAAVILGKKTGRPAATIHRTIFEIEKGVQLVDRKMCFVQRKNDDSETTIYFIDESSMISDIPSDNDMFKFGSGCLLQDLLKYCNGRKVVFVGDSAQLPPVGQSTSPALDDAVLEKKYGRKVMSACLRQVVRQDKDSGIYDNSISIRTAIEKGNFNEFSIKEGADVRHSPNLFDDYAAVVNGAVDIDSVIITYSNALALEYNKRVRAMLFQHTSERLIGGDLIIISRNNYAYNTELFNGTIVSVASCEADDEIESREVRFYSSEKDKSGKAIVKNRRLDFRSVTLDLGDQGLLKCKILDSFLTDEEPAPDLELTQALSVDFTNRHPNLTNGSDEYYNAIKHDPYLNAVICKYGYAITCHKAQGGEWKHVFVDMSRNQGARNSDFFRWAYTAVTRSNTNLWVANAPKFDLFSEMQVGPVMKGGNIEFYTPEGVDFMDYRLESIRSQCESLGLNCHEDRSRQYLHILDITDNHGGNCVVQMCYGKSGYTGKDHVTKSTSPELSDKVTKMCRVSLVPKNLNFQLVSENSERLYDYIVHAASSVGLILLNVVQLPYLDRFFMTNGTDYEVLSFTYTGKGKYVRCTLQSSAGQQDEQLLQMKTIIGKE